MENTYGAVRDIGALTQEEYTALLVRVLVGILYLSHPLLMWAIFGLEHAAHYFASVALPPSTAYLMVVCEVVGGAMLLLGLYVRQAAIGLLPIAIGAGAVHFGTDLGAGLSYGAYLAGCITGQGLLASGVLTPQPDRSEEDFATSPGAAHNPSA
jgi:putative oxidoreductase